MNQAEMTIPYLFICPISLDLFKDPVTLCTGQTYDRSSIEKWLSTGNLTCPVTMQRLHDISMVPNHTLRHLIDEWLKMGPQLDPDYLKTIGSLASLKHSLESYEVTLEKKFQALKSIQSLSDELISRNSCLIQLGFLPLLFELVFGSAESKLSQESINFAEKSLSCILKLLPILGDLESLNKLKEESKLESFRILLEQGSIMIQEGLCHLIEGISSLETKELCAIIGENRQILQGLILLVQQTSGVPEAGIKAIYALCSLESNKENLVQAGVINGLLMYISNTERRENIRNLAPKAMATIEILLGLETAKDAVINNPNGVNSLVKMVFRVSDHEGSESAVRSLMVICSDSLQAREEAICRGVLTQLLLLLQSQCSVRTKTKARMLLKLLRSKWNEEKKHF